MEPVENLGDLYAQPEMSKWSGLPQLAPYKDMFYLIQETLNWDEELVHCHSFPYLSSFLNISVYFQHSWLWLESVNYKDDCIEQKIKSKSLLFLVKNDKLNQLV